MGELHEYSRKRSFADTPEPQGDSGASPETNRFVIQRHLARREHYDFRLQVGDVLVSWAVPKRPVDDPEVKRLAIKVEDHPLDYIHFEGTIPKGNYGAGTVMVWDIGYYYLEGSRQVPTAEDMRRKLRKGALKLYLQGAKLQGYYNLVAIKDSDNDEWFFMKSPQADGGEDIFERSALSGRSMEEIAQSDLQWHADKGALRKPAAAKADGPAAGRAAFPGFVRPMLATLAAQPFSDDRWLFERKLDGYRIIAAKEGDRAELFTRNGNLYTGTYATIAAELCAIKAGFVVDGEVCYIDSERRADFQKLQNNDREQERLHYFVFDLLWLNGHDTKNLPLRERKKLLQVLLAESPPHVHYVDHASGDGIAFFARMEAQRQEGMIAKKADGRYFPGNRTRDWLKVKTGFRQEMLICGFTPSDKANRPFASLLCAVHHHGGLLYTGRVGTGFNERLQDDIDALLAPLRIDSLVLDNAPRDGNIRWVRPELVAEVRFSSWTNDGIMRHPSFVALRHDKKPQDIRLEQPVEPVAPQQKIRLSNLDKVFWPEEGYTKEDVVAYYRDVAPIILPYLVDRPQSLYRTPHGLAGKGFFQKNVSAIAPHWAATHREDNSKGGVTEYLLCQDSDTLLFMANLGCIEINPWSSSLPHLDNPDFMIFDLDPVEVGFDQVVKVAREFKKLFDRLDMPVYCKTSGSRGLHLYVPVLREYSYDQVQKFVKLFETHVHRQHGDLTSFERMPAARRGKIYLDYLQNGRGKTMASVYSIRPRPGAPVSAPLSWDEVEEGLDPAAFTLTTMRRRLERRGDLWQDMFERRVDMKKVLDTFAGM